MLDKYIILNRKPTIIISIFIYTFILFIALILYLSNILTYTSYYKKNSCITYINNNYLLKLDIPIDKLNLVTKQNQIILDKNKYKYQVYKIDNNITSNNYQTVYLEIYNLEDSYKFNNYCIKVLLKDKEQKIINYIKGGT